jgi:hypothetical protein
LNKFQQWVDLYDIPQDKITKVTTFQLADEAAVWYATLKPEITNNFQKFKEAFFKRFTEDDRIEFTLSAIAVLLVKWALIYWISDCILFTAN